MRLSRQKAVLFLFRMLCKTVRRYGEFMRHGGRKIAEQITISRNKASGKCLVRFYKQARKSKENE